MYDLSNGILFNSKVATKPLYNIYYRATFSAKNPLKHSNHKCSRQKFKKILKKTGNPVNW